MYPITVDALGFQERSTLCCTGIAPVPVAIPVIDGTEALLAKEMFAEAVPLICGAKVTANGTFCPAAKVRGRVIPLSVNSALLELAEDTVTLEPVALSVPVCF